MNRYFQVFLFLIIAVLQTQVVAAGITWHNYSEKIFTQAKAAKKPILIYGKAEWCPYCKRMNQTFANPQVTAIVNKNFYPVIIDVDENPAIANQYGLQTLPTIVILDGYRSIKESFIGYSSAADFSYKLERYLNE